MQSTEALAERSGLHRLEVARIVQETADARSIVFAVPPALRSAFRYQAGQFLTLEVEHEGARLRRCYSLASSPECDDEHKVTVKRVAGGRVSNWLHDRLREGDSVAVIAPEGRFVLRKSDAPLVLFAGGSGITPVISIAKTALATTARSVRLVYANRDERSVIFAREIAELGKRHAGRLEVVHRFDDVHGFMDPGGVRELVRSADVECYLCGPAPFMVTVESALAEAGVRRESVHIERFVSLASGNGDAKGSADKPSEALASDAVPDVIGVTLEGKRHLVPYQAGKSILRAALDAGLAVPFSCEEGFCGCCTARVLEGSVAMDAHDALTPEEMARGLVLTCQAKPRTPKCAVEYLEGV
jgi:3-ketosteroid 9alpha-monooxygenase subunit B